MTTGIQLAVAAAGGQSALARQTGLSKSYIHDMLKAGLVTPHQCQLIHSKTGVPLVLLNPEIYTTVAINTER